MLRARKIPVVWLGAEGGMETRLVPQHGIDIETLAISGVRGKGRDTAKAMADEGARVLAALPKNAHVVALDGRGKMHASEQLATRLEHWRGQGRDMASGRAQIVMEPRYSGRSMRCPLSRPGCLARRT